MVDQKKLGVDSSILSLFPVPIFTVDNFLTDDEKNYLLLEVDKENHHKHSAFTESSFSTHGSGINFLQKSNFYGIFEKTTNLLNEFASTYGIKRLKITTSWSNIQNSGSELIDHMHPNSKISGCIYLNVDEDSSKIYFHNPNPYVMFEDFTHPSPYNHHYYWLQPKNNQLIMFPSWLKHGSNKEKNKTNGRVSIAFNSELI